MTTIKPNQLYNIQWWNGGELKETINLNAQYGVAKWWIRTHGHKYTGHLIQKAIN